MRCLLLPAFLTALGLFTLSGCDRGSKNEWEVTVENKTTLPCSFFITMGADGSSKPNVAAVTRGKPETLIAGSTDTIVQTIRVIRGADEQTLSPNTPLPVGKRYTIIVMADGKVEASISGR